MQSKCSRNKGPIGTGSRFPKNPEHPRWGSGFHLSWFSTPIFRLLFLVLFPHGPFPHACSPIPLSDRRFVLRLFFPGPGTPPPLTAVSGWEHFLSQQSPREVSREQKGCWPNNRAPAPWVAVLPLSL